jgi:hypothetical protein
MSHQLPAYIEFFIFILLAHMYRYLILSSYLIWWEGWAWEFLECQSRIQSLSYTPRLADLLSLTYFFQKVSFSWVLVTYPYNPSY